MEGDLASGTIYVLRSKYDHPLVAAHRAVLRKIGVTSGNAERRIANAALEPTFLTADVEVVATYDLYNINRAKLENLIHHIFDPARLDIEIKDRFGNPVPRASGRYAEERREMKDSLTHEVKPLCIEITALQETLEEPRALNHSEKARVIDMPRRAN